MTDPHHISATQISMAQQCLRSWGWAYLAGHKTTSTAMLVGIRVHDSLEHYLRDGTLPKKGTFYQPDGSKKYYDVGLIALNMIRHLPTNVETVEVENSFTEEINGINYVGKIDWTYRKQHMRRDTSFYNRLNIHDHKTSSDPKKWAKLPSELKTDIQAILYSKVGFKIYENFFANDKITFTLGYGCSNHKKPFNAINVSVDMEREDVDQKFEEIIEPTAEKLIDLYNENDVKIINPLDLSPNWNACEGYGGCPHLHRCGQAPNESKGIFTMAKSPVAAKLAAMQAKKKKGAPKPKAAPRPKPKAAPVQQELPETEAAEETPVPETEDTPAPKKRGPKPGSKRGRKPANKPQNLNEVLIGAALKEIASLPATAELADLLLQIARGGVEDDE